jgi:hypothetical protein
MVHGNRENSISDDDMERAVAMARAAYADALGTDSANLATQQGGYWEHPYASMSFQTFSEMFNVLRPQ